MSIPLGLGKSVIAVELFDLERNQRIGTFHREGSQCIFSDTLHHHDFELGLRLDWGDLHEGEPTLDLDVVRVKTDGTKLRLKPAKVPVHHTRLSDFYPGSLKPRFYDLIFEGLHLRLVARKTFASSIGMSIYVVDPDSPCNS
jgi:hypothetical protein